MNKVKLLSICTMFVPWLTVPFLGKTSLKRFTPIAIITNVLWSLISIYAKNNKWWKASPFILKKSKIDVPFVVGLFFVTTLWVFKWTYGNFKRYITLNALLDTILAFPIVAFYEKVGAFNLKKATRLYLFGMVWSLSILIYGIQYIVELASKEKKTTNKIT